MCVLFACLFSVVRPIVSEKFESSKFSAIIVEPRSHPALEFVLKNAIDHLSDEWTIIIMHGTKNKEFVENIVNNNLAEHSARIKLHNLNVENLTIQEYNNLLISKQFYDHVPTDTFLIFQTDSMICNSTDVKISQFTGYDYVGAPLAHIERMVGNGGFSLRKKSKMLEVIEKCKYDGTAPEDIYFQGCLNAELNKPSSDEAAMFSNEGEYSKLSFGVHKPWIWFTPEQLKLKTESCPGLDTLAKLNKHENK